MKTMKKIILPSLLLFCLLNFTGCSKKGEVGPQGTQGAQGEKGDKGAKGDPGNANVEVYNFSNFVFPSGLPTQTVTISPSFAVSADLLVLGYYQQTGNAGWIKVGGPTLDGQVFLQEYFLLNNDNKSIEYVVRRTKISDGSAYTTGTTPLTKLKVIVALPSVVNNRKSHPPFDPEDYNSVAEYYGLEKD